MDSRAECIDSFNKAIGPDLFSALAEEWTTIGHGLAVPRSCLPDVADACRDAGVSAEQMLIAVRQLSLTCFRWQSAESERVNSAWSFAARSLLDAYHIRP